MVGIGISRKKMLRTVLQTQDGSLSLTNPNANLLIRST